jgi:hypothetical protein
MNKLRLFSVSCLILAVAALVGGFYLAEGYIKLFGLTILLLGSAIELVRHEIAATQKDRLK